MRFAIVPPYDRGVQADPDWMTRLADVAERLGFESLYLPEHAAVATGHAPEHHYTTDGGLGLPDDTPFPDPLAVLGHLAARTTRLRLGTGMLILPQHHPVLLAKRLATLDVLSGGRVQVGLGVGWMREELSALGVDPATRGRRADEAIQVLRALWRDDPADFRGEFFAFTGLRCFPKPVQPGGIPLHVGGQSEAAARRAGRLADGFHPLGVDGARLRRLTGVVRESAERAGRDPDRIELTLTCDLAAADDASVARAAAAGVDRLVLTCRGLSFERLAAALAQVAERNGLTTDGGGRAC
ncbi:LLM class F420-dependent oxidoreductase [Streptomyces spiralis]|uniref:LLM class F420-dependent oxidoreductase n=1 Tax=Streptomyces spiralis TaxID=66376 RepID=UPI003400C456